MLRDPRKSAVCVVRQAYMDAAWQLIQKPESAAM